MPLLDRLTDPAAVQAALDEFAALGRSAFLDRYGFGRARDFMVRDPRTGVLADSKAIAGAAYGLQHPEAGPLKPSEFSGGEATVVPKLEALGFEIVRIGEDWSIEEVEATVTDYFDMLLSEARGDRYVKSDHNAALRRTLQGRSKAAVELKHQNISAILHALDLPFIPGYKPRGNSQLLLRKAVQRFVTARPEMLVTIVDGLEEAKTPGEKTFTAVVAAPPLLAETAVPIEAGPRLRLPRKVDFASRDEANRLLGRAGERWVLGFEQRRLQDEGTPGLFEKVDWVSERLGDGTGYDILSFEADGAERFIEVKTTNGAKASPFVVSRNELDFSSEVGDRFHLYRVFEFRQQPQLYMLRGELSRQVHLEAIDYRASFRRLVG